MNLRWGAPAAVAAALVLAACVGEDAIVSVNPPAQDAGQDATAPGVDASGASDGGIDSSSITDGSATEDAGDAAPGLRLDLSDLKLDLGTVDVGKNARKTLTATNKSGASLTTTVKFSGSTEFTVSSDGCNGVALANDAQCAVEIELAPTAYGEKVATLDFSVGGTIVAKSNVRGAGRDTVTLEVTTGGTGGAIGKVTGGGLDCGATCAITVERTTTAPTVTITAVPDAKSGFTTWTGACSGTTPTCDVPTTSPTAGKVVVGATFEPLEPLVVTLTRGADTAGVTVASVPAGLTCTGGTCTGYFASGTAVQVNVTTTDTARVFDCPGVPASTYATDCSLTMDQPRSLRVATMKYNYAFVSDDRYAANLGGVAGADAKCDALAVAAGLPGHFKAWLSTDSVDAKDRVAAGGLVRVDGAIVARTKADLVSGRILHPIVLDSKGKAHAGPGEDFYGEQVWASTSQLGVMIPGGSCGGWTATTGTGNCGGAESSNVAWTRDYGCPCVEPHRLYCFGTDSAATVPMPVLSDQRIAFISKGSLAANAGIVAMDALCASEAAGVPRAGTFAALVAPSDAVSAASRFTDGKPWARVDGVQVAKTATDLLSGKLEASIDLSADGVVRDVEVWSGYRITSFDPRSFTEVPGAATCTGWTDNDVTKPGGVARTGNIGFRVVGSLDLFTSPGATTCADSRPVYCLQK